VKCTATLVLVSCIDLLRRPTTLCSGRPATRPAADPDGPRRTGDGYYQSVVLGLGGNHIEVTVQPTR
jgi:hypothetical protein